MILMNILLLTFGNKKKHSRGPMPHDFPAAGWKPFFGSTAPLLGLLLGTGSWAESEILGNREFEKRPYKDVVNLRQFAEYKYFWGA